MRLCTRSGLARLGGDFLFLTLTSPDTDLCMVCTEVQDVNSFGILLCE